ncbi:hypothetical protein Rs2_09776 [Raphanus sativus]|nr:hypothetical protein Rs2_09776 [Raphanus sativus]
MGLPLSRTKSYAEIEGEVKKIASNDSTVFTVAIEYIVWEVYTEVKALQLQSIDGLVFQEYVTCIKNTIVAQETTWQGKDAFRVLLDLSRELAQALKVLPHILKRGLQIVHGAAIFQVKHMWNIKHFQMSQNWS